MRVFRFTVRLLIFLVFISCKGFSQETEQEKYAALKNVIDTKDFRFIPQAATTAKGNTVTMDPGYLLKLLNDSLVVDLPYFESGYTVAFGAADDIVKFNSKQFTYSAETTKKGGWNIIFIPKDDIKIRRIHLNITREGYCTMQLNIVNKPPITYSGVMGDNFSRQ